MKSHVLNIITLCASCLTFFEHTALADNESIKIGAVLYLTTDVAAQASAFNEGISLAQQESGANVHIIVESVTSPSETVTAVKKLISIDNIDAGIINGYPDVQSTADIIERSKKPFMVLWDSSPEIDNAGEYIFSLGIWTPSTGAISGYFAYNNLHAKRAAIISQIDVWSEAIAKSFTETFTSKGGVISSRIDCNPDEVDFSTTVTKILASKPEVIYSSSWKNVAMLFKKLAERNKAHIPIITADVLSLEHIRQSPQYYKNVYQSGIVDPTSAQFIALSEKYELHYKKKITYPWFVATGYDAAKLLIKAAQEKNRVGTLMKKYLYAIKNYKGASSLISINEKGSSPQKVGMYKIENDSFVATSVLEQ